MKRYLIQVTTLIFLASCAPSASMPKRFPATEYAERIKSEQTRLPKSQAVSSRGYPDARASIRFAADTESPTEKDLGAESAATGQTNEVVTNAPEVDALPEPEYKEYSSSAPLTRDYNGPLSLGDPGVSASLWRESGADNDLFHDHRAWQPMDLITIVVSENSEGKKEADTDVSTESTFNAAIQNLFGLENDKNFQGGAGVADVDLTNLINATTNSEFKGEGSTNRKDSLKARLSAMVAEVLPSGVLRIEGEKIVSVNNEEQIMIISGLVRTRDVNSVNEVDSSKIANMRIDYFGRGSVGDAQTGGWLGNFLRHVWPF